MSPWKLRTVPPELVARYLAAGFWTDDTLGGVLDAAVGNGGRLEFRVWSQTRPFKGTVRGVYDLGRRVAAGLRTRGFGPGDPIAFQLPNWMEAGATFYGAALLGAVIVPIVPFYGPREVAYILRESRARALVTTDAFGHNDYLRTYEAMRGDLPDLEASVFLMADAERDVPDGAIRFADLLDATPIASPVDVDPDQPVLVGYTSGTTAAPKGVIHTHRTILAELRQLRAMAVSRGRPAVVGAPVGHAIGMLGGLLMPLMTPTAIHLIDVWNPPVVLAAMVECNATAGSGSTFFLQSLLDDPACTPEHHRLIENVGMGGAPVPAAFADRVEGLGISLVRSFGSTEHPSTTGSQQDDPRVKRNHTDGRALAGVDLRLVDADGQEVPPGTPGEILSRGPDLCLGYTDPELTASTFDADGWYRSGDMGVLDEDGFLTITDRVKDVIIRGGENISAAEIEELMVRMDGVLEVACVAAPDRRLGEHVCAFVRLAPDVDGLELDAVRAHLEAAGLTRQKWPEEVRPVPDLPRTPAGKVKKSDLRAALRDEATEPGR